MSDLPSRTGKGLERLPSLATELRGLTPARVGLRRTGNSVALEDLLDFQLAHARARDAVHTRLEPAGLAAELKELTGLAETVVVHSAAKDRETYLQRPDLGRQLDEASLKRLETRQTGGGYDLAVVMCDGLSALAVERHAARVLAAMLPGLPPASRMAPVCIVEQGRVAVGDAIASVLGAEMVIVLIGERPGLSSPDSLGAYVTWKPEPGKTTDAERNCISNIRSEGLSYAEAAARLLHYIHEATRMRLTGVALKDPEPDGSDLDRPLLEGGR